MIKRIKRYMAPAMSAVTFAFALAACSSDDPDFPMIPDEPGSEAPQKETTKVGLTISLGSDWNIDLDDETETRALPPGTGNNQQKEEPVDGSKELADIDKVRVVTFRRVDPDDADPDKVDELAQASFVYDSTNDLILDKYEAGSKPDADLFPETAGHTSHRLFKGEILKVMGFEYRIVAIAYSDKTGTQFGVSGIAGLPEGDSGKFTLNLRSGLTLEEFEANLNDHISLTSGTWRDFFRTSNADISDTNAKSLGKHIVETPQFFYGECSTGAGSNVIKYAEKDGNGDLVKDTPIRGILYRGVAKIEVQIEKVSRYHSSLAVYRDPQWIALMADNVPLKVSLDNYDRFLLPNGNILNEGYVPVAFTTTSRDAKATIETYILPCASRLGLRIRYDGNLRNGQLRAQDTETGGNATGVISPDSHDGIYYLRRNHKYVIKVKDSENIMTKYSFN